LSEVKDNISDNYEAHMPNHTENNTNIFRNNLDEERKLSSRNTIEIVASSRNDEANDEDENESLSKMEPP
jgi:hypothetical protein